MDSSWKLIDKIHNKEKEGSIFFSAEFFPPRTEAGAINLFTKFDRLSIGGPLFIDITWGAGGGNPTDLNLCTGSLFIASTAINYCGLPTMLHLTAMNNTKNEIRDILNKAKELGIRNILALRGDIPDKQLKKQDFVYAVDLIKFIREETGDYFGICVAGYPNGHPDCVNLDEDIQHLKDKIMAGADFVITQLFFEPEIFINFVKKCRSIGITCPIIPGILPIQSYASLRHLMKLSKIKPPDHIISILERNKDDDSAVREFGISYAIDMCRKIIMAQCTPGFHFYTLNQEEALIEITKNLGLWNTPIRSKPWLISANQTRAHESTRPIFWSYKPKSYLLRTKDNNEFPNGRWGISSSPAFGDLKNYYLFKPRNKTLLGKLNSMNTIIDISSLFCDFITGNISYLPWCEDSALSPETHIIRHDLLRLNHMGIFTINSQPSINGILSSDPIYGWGGSGGYVYQKAYLEFFISPISFHTLLDILPNFPSITYHALNQKGQTFSNTHNINTVTWGVFPDKEIIQPTVVDPDSFPIWKDEAFEMWKDFSNTSILPDIIQTIYDTYYLVNLVDNDYISGNIFAPFDILVAST